MVLPKQGFTFFFQSLDVKSIQSARNRNFRSADSPVLGRPTFQPDHANFSVGREK